MKRNFKKPAGLLFLLAFALTTTTNAQSSLNSKVIRVKDISTGKYLAFDYTNADTRLVEKTEDEAGANCLFKVERGSGDAGAYITSLTNNKVWDLYSSSFSGGGAIGSYTKNGSYNQRWLLLVMNPLTHAMDIRNAADLAYALDYTSSHGLFMNNDRASYSPKFIYEEVDMHPVAADAVCAVVNKASNTPLGLQNNDDVLNDNLVKTKAAGVNANSNQWRFEDDHDYGYKISNVSTEKVLTLKDPGGFYNGNELNQWRYVSSPGQRWLVWKDSHGDIRIASGVTGKFVAVYDPAAGSDCKVVQWESAGDNSRWILQDKTVRLGDLSNKVVRFRNVGIKNKYMTLAYTKADTKLTANQRMKLAPICCFY